MIAKTTTQPTPAAVAAANWWAEQIGAPTFRLLAADATGHEREVGDLASIMLATIAAKNPVPVPQPRRGGDVDALALAAAAAVTDAELAIARLATIRSQLLMQPTRTPTAGAALLGSNPNAPTSEMSLVERVGAITRRHRRGTAGP